MSRGAVKKERIREVEGIPGTVEPGFKNHPITELQLPLHVREAFLNQGIRPAEIDLRIFTMGPCNIMRAREPAGVNGEILWHLTISEPSRHPTWDEIKAARYDLIPDDVTMGMLLPPRAFYVNVPEQDHVFQLWEVLDPRAPWTTG